MTTSAKRAKLSLEYVDTIGFVADQGGRGFHMPMGMAIRDDGRIFVASRSNTEALNIVGIQIVTLDHDHFGQYSGFGQGDGQMTWPTALALDGQDNIYMSDDLLQRISVFDRDGNYLSKWGTKGSGVGEFDGPSGLAFDSEDNLLVVDHRNNRVQRYIRDGKFLSQFGESGDGNGQFNLPWGISIDPHGFIWVADWRNDRVQKFTPDGQFVAKYGRSGDGDGEFSRPSSVVADAEGYIYVADWGNQRVQILGPDGSFITKLRGQATLSVWAREYLEANADELAARSRFEPVFETDTDDPHEQSALVETYFWDPVQVKLDSQDRLYVLETSRHRFQVFQVNK